jgi:hypothetical protein
VASPVDLPALAPLPAVACALVGAIGSSDDRQARLVARGAALTVQFHHYVGAQHHVLLVATDPLIQLGRRALARYRTASGLRASMPKPGG